MNSVIDIKMYEVIRIFFTKIHGVIRKLSKLPEFKEMQVNVATLQYIKLLFYNKHLAPEERLDDHEDMQ